MCREEHCHQAWDVKVFKVLKINPSGHRKSLYSQAIWNIQRHSLCIFAHKLHLRRWFFRFLVLNRYLQQQYGTILYRLLDSCNWVPSQKLYSIPGPQTLECSCWLKWLPAHDRHGYRQGLNWRLVDWLPHLHHHRYSLSLSKEPHIIWLLKSWRSKIIAMRLIIML